jgi:hypothetical protein
MLFYSYFVENPMVIGSQEGGDVLGSYLNGSSILHPPAKL